MSRVTAWRYLERLADEGTVTRHTDYGRRGPPEDALPVALSALRRRRAASSRTCGATSDGAATNCEYSIGVRRGDGVRR